MSTGHLVSDIMLWVVALVQSVILLALLRQVGVLHLRINPVGARVLPAGPELKRPAPVVVIEDAEDLELPLRIARPMQEAALLIFLSSPRSARRVARSCRRSEPWHGAAISRCDGR